VKTQTLNASPNSTQCLLYYISFPYEIWMSSLRPDILFAESRSSVINFANFVLALLSLLAVISWNSWILLNLWILSTSALIKVLHWICVWPLSFSYLAQSMQTWGVTRQTIARPTVKSTKFSLKSWLEWYYICLPSC